MIKLRFTGPIVFLPVCLLVHCSVRSGHPESAAGPATESFPAGRYATIVHVSLAGGSDTEGAGSREAPWASLRHALSSIAQTGPENRAAVLVAAGDYEVETLAMREYADLYGGFDPETWIRDIRTFRTLLTGTGEKRVLVAADHTLMDGFTVANGRVRGKGAGLYANGVSPVVRNNTFIGNRTLAPEPWNPEYLHETAHDGGAVYCENGAAPVIENNLFVENSTENGRGAAIALHNRCGGRIAGNVFLRNTAGLNDPMRSSDGGAVSVFDWSHPAIENNIFLNNRALAHNDGGGLFVALWSSPVIAHNVFAGNQCGDDAGALFVGGQEHRYDASLDPLPPEDKFYVKIHDNLFAGNSNPSRNSGVMRFTMESRGEFIRNTAVYNTGIYFQRSEALIEDNRIFDRFLLVETKEGLHPCVIRNNIIRGDFRVETEAVVEGNRTGRPEAEKPVPRESGTVLVPAAMLADRNGITTWMKVPGEAFRPDGLRGRIVRAGDIWGVVRSNTRTEIEVWGDLGDRLPVILLPDVGTW